MGITPPPMARIPMLRRVPPDFGGVFGLQWSQSCYKEWLRRRTNKEIINRLRPTFSEDAIWVRTLPRSEFGRMWQHEFARRFYLRPLEARPNTQGGDVLVRALPERYIDITMNTKC
jgi:hypothetical protein